MEDMATLNIKNFPDRVYRRVKRLADRENRSIAQQIIHMISRATEESEQESILELRGLGKDASAIDTEQDGAVTWRVFYVVAPDGLCYWFGERQAG